MNSLYKSELFKLAFILCLGALVGSQLDEIWLGVAVASLFYVFSMLRYYRSFQLWLSQGGADERPVANGFWATITDQVHRLLRDYRAEQKRLQDDVEYFTESFQALDSAVLVIDHRGMIDWCNDAARPLLGIDIQKDKGQRLLNLLRIPELTDYLESQQYDAPLTIASPSIRTIQLEVQATLFRKNFTLIFARDVSDILRLEQMRQDFVANVSHELRTPLTVITGYLETLKDNSAELSPVWERAIAQMLDQTDRMDAMVEDLIWLSRLESMPVERSAADVIALEGLLQSILSDALVASPGKQIKLLINTPADNNTGLEKSDMPMSIRGNYEELRSAFSNLLQNAVKYTGEDGEILIECYFRSNTFNVRFRDDGEGIDPVHIPRLTERFYRVDSSRTSTTGGTGLGLAIVKHVLARHNGQLAINSKLGVGSQFTCVFPSSIVENQ